MNVMGCRLAHLIATMAGYQKTGISLISWDGNHLLPTMPADDVGIYILIPKCASFFRIGIEQAISIFFNFLLIIPAVVAIIVFCMLYKKPMQRCVAISGVVLLTLFARAVGDVYLCYSASLLLLLPFILYFFERKKFGNSFIAVCIYVGFIVGILQFIRSFSAIAPLLFFFTALLFEEELSMRRKFFFACAILLGMIAPIYYFNTVQHKSRAYAVDQLLIDAKQEKSHPLWHTLYVSFGLLHFKNTDNISYDDSCAAKKVESIDSSVAYCSAAYDEVLKNEVINLIKNQFVFVLLTLFAKLGVLIYFLLKFANIGLVAAFFYPKSWVIELAFFCALIFNSLFVFIAMPIHEYALGFIACATLYGIVSINYAIARMHFVKLPRWLLG